MYRSVQPDAAASRLRRRLQDADAGGAHGDDPPARPAGIGDRGRGAAGGISYHSVWMRCSSTYSPSSGRNVSRPTWSVTLVLRTPPGFQLVEELRGEVESGGRGRRGARRPGVDGLVALRGARAVVDVGWERRLAGVGHHRGRIPIEADRPGPLAERAPPPRPRHPSDRRGMRAPGRSLRWVGRAPRRRALAQVPEEEDLRAGPPPKRVPSQPRGNHARVVHDQEISRTKPLPDLAEDGVAQRRGAGARGGARSRTRRRDASRGSAGTWAMVSSDSS